MALNRHIAPFLTHVEQVPVVKPMDIVLGNGIDLHVFNQLDYEVFKLELVFPDAGYRNAPKKGVASTTNNLLLSGTNKLSTIEINDQLDFYGSYIQKSCDYYNSSVTLYGNARYFEETVSLLFNAIAEAIFPENELLLNITKRISELNISKQKNSFLAGVSFNETLFGDIHPLGSFVDEEDINQITASDLQSFHAYAYRNIDLILSCRYNKSMGDFLNNCTTGTMFQKSKVTSVENEVFYSNNNLIKFVEKADSLQASLCLGKIMPSRQHTDYLNIVLLNVVLGGYFGSRLMKNIREEKGLTYSINSSLGAYRSFSVFKIRSDFKNDSVNELVSETRNEILKLSNDLISHNELELAKNYLIGNFQRSMDGAIAQSERFKLILELGINYNFYEGYIQNIRKITPTDLKKTAQNYFQLNSFIEIVAGQKV